MKKTFRILLPALLMTLLTACGQAEWGKERDLGKAAAEAGDIDQAIEHYERAIELNPEFDNAKRELEKIREKIEKEEEWNQTLQEEADRRENIDKWINDFPADTVEKDVAPIAFEVFDDSHSSPSEIVSKLEYDQDKKQISITVKGRDGWSEDSITLGFYEDSTAIYKELAKDERIQSTLLKITFPMKDVNGNIEDDEVMVTWMSRETMNKVDWENFNYRNLLEVVDGEKISPQFVQ